ncbi:MAG TPA: DPP IV N-terminal domain-containing protein, partial [Longimicrobiales bacterium]|nr:DPP IV N-terminal domain-containing protein [Longimicrobiales bacterium]
MRRPLETTFAALFLSAALAAPLPAGLVAQGAESGPDSVLSAGHFLHWESVGSPQISPDGDRIVFTRARVDRVEDEWESAIWIMNADGTRKRHLVDGSNPVWSPDGDRLAYVAEGEPGGTQVFVRWMDGEGGPTQVTHLTEGPRNLQWSPDGTRLSFLMDVPAETGWKADVPAPPEGAEWTEAPRVVHRIHYRADGVGFTDETFTHLFTVPADGGSARQLTSGEWNVGARFDGLPFGGSYDWVPDGSAIVFDGWREGDPDRNFRASHLYAVDVETLEVRRLTTEPGTWTAPEVSPDGRTVAFAGYSETDRTYVASDLWAMPLDGSGSKRRLSGELDRDPQDLHWAADGSGVWFTAEDRGSENVHFAPLSGDGP